MSGREFLLYGTSQREPEARLVRAGRLSAEFINGNLRTIAYDGVEALRGVSYLVRDKDWGTYAPVLSNLEIIEHDDAFTISFDARCDGPDCSALQLSASIVAGRRSLAFEVSALPLTDFVTNRCGFCLLHPILGLAGSPVSVEHVSGDVVQSVLPDQIDPWQPFKNMRAITHQILPGISAECRMEGDAFEMEDQRNWSDASYKTYVRPLELPWPYLLKAGVEVRQKVTLTVSGGTRSRRSASAPGDEPVRVSLGKIKGRMPGISLAIAPQDIDASLEAVSVLAQIAPQQLLMHFDPLSGHGMPALAGFAQLQKKSGIAAALELSLPCRDDPAAELLAIAHQVRSADLALSSLIVSPSVDRMSTPPGSNWPDCPPLETVYAAARTAFPHQRLGGGMLSYFTELNRKRVPPDQLDFVTHATNPIVHAADDLSIMQTLEALPFITRSVRAIYGDRAYHIGPSTIAMRQNPYGDAVKENPNLDRVPMVGRDPRHNGLFAAAWAAGYAARCLAAQPRMLTLSALAGDFGLIAGAGEPSPKGGARPLFHVVQALSACAGAHWTECIVSNPAQIAAIAAAGPENRRTFIVANLTPQAKMADLSALRLESGSELSMLDENSVAQLDALTIGPAPEMLRLNAYAVAFVHHPSRAGAIA